MTFPFVLREQTAQPVLVFGVALTGLFVVPFTGLFVVPFTGLFVVAPGFFVVPAIGFFVVFFAGPAGLAGPPASRSGSLDVCYIT